MSLDNGIPKTVYRWSCNKCGLRGKTQDKNFQCHEGKTRIVVDDSGDEE